MIDSVNFPIDSELSPGDTDCSVDKFFVAKIMRKGLEKTTKQIITLPFDLLRSVPIPGTRRDDQSDSNE